MTMVLLDANRHGREFEPSYLREVGVRAATVSQIMLRGRHRAADRQARIALQTLVDAFLGDRRRNADLFTRAIRLGRMLSETAGCKWTCEGERYTLMCPIFALRRGCAHSIAMTTTEECSICGAETFGCEHVPGETYDGETCHSRVTRISEVGHIAFTANPDFVYTWHQPRYEDTRDLIRRGVIESAGDDLYCRYCESCPEYPSPEDLDPIERFERLKASAT